MSFPSTLDAPLAAAQLHEIDAICDRFESACRAGQRPDLASFLAEAPAGGLALLFRDLLNLDLEFRVKNGEKPERDGYLRRFPDLTDQIDAAFALLGTTRSLRAWVSETIGAARQCRRQLWKVHPKEHPSGTSSQ